MQHAVKVVFYGVVKCMYDQDCFIALCGLQADFVTSVTFVDGKGVIYTVDRDSTEGRGLMGGLGMLGVITEVTLKLQVRV